MPPDPAAALLAHAAAHLRGVRNDPPLTASRIVAGALEIVPGAGHASVTVRRGKDRWASLAVTSELAHDVDQAQYSLREGPCLDAATNAEWFRSGDVGSDPRWPRWGPRAARSGIRSMLSIRLLAGGAPIGALNLYAEEGGRFAERDVVDLAVLFATHAALALAASEQIDGLETAMSSRHTIGMAQGILMERYLLSPEQAFALLQRMSSTSNVKLRAVAEGVVSERSERSEPA